MMSFEETKSLVTNVILNYGKHLKESNVPEIIKLYAEYAELIPHGAQSLKGKRDIENSYEKGFKYIKIIGDLEIKSIDIFDNVAIVRCEEPSQVKSLKKGSIHNTYFRELFVLVRNQETQNWEIYKYMFSENPNQAQ
ncbi:MULTISPECIES: hypothetical protein [Sphingobacterium]|uniref:hypothetical protein n=1 Tax=Sphingobacterium TaxID=28453 RepID=UPI001051278E|nr:MULTISPECIES: hypothetical protein [Sphingobacterium]MCW2264032.1 ketosteroid isomerase-like protein [Sphingobacterium kitahiroshimense]